MDITKDEGALSREPLRIDELEYGDLFVTSIDPGQVCIKDNKGGATQLADGRRFEMNTGHEPVMRVGAHLVVTFDPTGAIR